VEDKGPSDFVGNLWVYPYKVQLQELIWPHLFPSFARIVEDAPKHCSTVSVVENRNGKSWMYEGSQEAMFQYLNTVLPFFGYEQISVVAIGEDGVALDPHHEFVGLVETEDEAEGEGSEGEGSEGEGALPPSHLDAIMELKSLQGTWERGLKPRAQVIREVVMIVRRKDNHLYFSDHAFDALLQQIEGAT
jgi:hypothetical protein